MIFVGVFVQVFLAFMLSKSNIFFNNPALTIVVSVNVKLHAKSLADNRHQSGKYEFYLQICWLF